MVPVCDVIPSRARPLVTIALIAANTLVFVYEVQLDRQQMYDLARALGVVPAELGVLAVLTGPFLHDGWIHLGANMLCLWIFGGNVEDALGRGAYLLFYVSSAAAATLAHFALYPSSLTPMIGASGAVAAVMGAYLVLYPRSQVLTAVVLVFSLDLIEVPAILFPGFWLLMQLLSPVASMGAQAADGGGALGAHAAGFLAGAAAGLALRRRGRAWP